MRLPTRRRKPIKDHSMVTSTGPGRVEYYSRLVSCQVEICARSRRPRFTRSSPLGHRQCIEGKSRFRQSARVPVRNEPRSKPALPCSPARTLRELLCGGCAGDSWAENFRRAQGCSAVRVNPTKSNSRKKSRVVAAFAEQFPLQTLFRKYKFAPAFEHSVLRRNQA